MTELSSSGTHGLLPTCKATTYILEYLRLPLYDRVCVMDLRGLRAATMKI